MFPLVFLLMDGLNGGNGFPDLGRELWGGYPAAQKSHAQRGDHPSLEQLAKAGTHDFFLQFFHMKYLLLFDALPLKLPDTRHVVSIWFLFLGWV